jgi:sec-independent protein translocase protein TatB
MCEIGWTKLLIVAVVALIAIGPKELPGVLRNVGRWIATLQRMKAELQNQIREALREAEMEGLKKQAEDLNEAARSVPHIYQDGKSPKSD